MRAVDIVIPCYNYSRYLEESVQSILSQRDVTVRILVIDDCSTDDTPHVGGDLARRYSNVTFRRHDRNAGHIATYNEGISWIEAPYFLLISADDLLTSGSLARSIDVFERQPDVGMVFGDAVVFKDSADLPRLSPFAESSYSIIQGSGFVSEICEKPHNPIATPAVLVRTPLQKELGGYEPRLPHTGDLEMWLRFASRSNLAKIDRPQAFRREHDTNMFRRYTAVTLGEQQHMKAVFDVLAESGKFLSAQHISRAYHGIAMDCLWRASTAFERGDNERCEAMLAFGTTLDPALVDHPSWRRLVWKRRIGRRSARVLSNVTDLLRQ